MPAATRTVRKGSYGFDAPYAPLGMAAGGVACFVMAAL
jgi:hypothetical protein